MTGEDEMLLLQASFQTTNQWRETWEMVLKPGGDCRVILISSGILATKLNFFFVVAAHCQVHLWSSDSRRLS